MKKNSLIIILLALFALISTYAQATKEVPAQRLEQYLASLNAPGTYKIKITGLEAFVGADYMNDMEHVLPNNKLVDELKMKKIFIDLSETEIPDGMGVQHAFWGWDILVATPEFLGKVASNSLDGSFAYCSNLKRVTNFPKNLESLSQTFEGCKSLSYVPEIPSSVGNLEYAFKDCTSLKTVLRINSQGPIDVSFGLIDFMANAFENCSSLESIEFFPDLPNNVVTIKETRMAYSDCFKGVPPTCKIYVSQDSLWNRLNEKGVALVKSIMGIADTNMFVAR